MNNNASNNIMNNRFNPLIVVGFDNNFKMKSLITNESLPIFTFNENNKHTSAYTYNKGVRYNIDYQKVVGWIQEGNNVPNKLLWHLHNIQVINLKLLEMEQLIRSYQGAAIKRWLQSRKMPFLALTLNSRSQFNEENDMHITYTLKMLLDIVTINIENINNNITNKKIFIEPKQLDDFRTFLNRIQLLFIPIQTSTVRDNTIVINNQINIHQQFIQTLHRIQGQQQPQQFIPQQQQQIATYVQENPEDRIRNDFLDLGPPAIPTVGPSPVQSPVNSPRRDDTNNYLNNEEEEEEEEAGGVGLDNEDSHDDNQTIMLKSRNAPPSRNYSISSGLQVSYNQQHQQANPLFPSSFSSSSYVSPSNVPVHSFSIPPSRTTSMPNEPNHTNSYRAPTGDLLFNQLLPMTPLTPEQQKVILLSSNPPNPIRSLTNSSLFFNPQPPDNEAPFAEGWQNTDQQQTTMNNPDLNPQVMNALYKAFQWLKEKMKKH